MSASLGQNNSRTRGFSRVCNHVSRHECGDCRQHRVLGLLVPHIVKMLVGYMHKYTIIYTGSSAARCHAVDMVARMLNETPVNAVIAMIGLLFFIYIIRQRGRQYA